MGVRQYHSISRATFGQGKTHASAAPRAHPHESAHGGALPQAPRPSSPLSRMFVILSLLWSTMTPEMPCHDAEPMELQQIVNAMALDGVKVRC